MLSVHSRPVVLAGWVTRCRVQPYPVIFVLGRLSDISDQAAMPLHATYGNSSTCTSHCSSRGLSSLEKGPQKPAVQGVGGMGADLLCLQTACSHCESASATSRCCGLCWGDTRQDTCKPSWARRGNRLVHVTRSTHSTTVLQGQQSEPPNPFAHCMPGAVVIES